MGSLPRTRARAVVVAAALLAGAAGLSGVSGAQTNPGAARPNILVVVTDDQRPDETMEVMPKTTAWLGGGGVEFTNGVVTMPLCCPSRASIFSGQYVHNHGVVNNGMPENLDQNITMQRYLHDAGYRTAISGKFLNNWDICNVDPPHFDAFAIMNSGYDGARFRVREETGQNNGCGTAGGDGHITVAPYSTTFVEENALAFLEEFEGADDDAPWFLYVAPYAPHASAQPEAMYADAPVPPWNKSPAIDEADVSDKPPHVRDTTRLNSVTSEEIEPFRASQLRSLMSVDDLMESLRLELLELDEEQDTVVVFLSDNGYLWADHGIEGKREVYEKSVRVPFFMRWPACGSAAEDGCPGALPEGTQDPRLLANIDLLPTLLEAAGVEPAHVVDGKSLWSTEPRSRILVEHYPSAGALGEGIPRWAAFYSPGDFLYRENHYEPGEGTAGCDDDDPATPCEYYVDAGEPDEYYDLAGDPYELDNMLAAAGPGAPVDLEQLSGELAAASECAGADCP